MSLYELALRPATLADVPLLSQWDREPHVIRATTDDPRATMAFGNHDWNEDLAQQSTVSFYMIAEVAGNPVGAMQIIDPELEPTHYWGDIESNLRAIDIWIGRAEDLSKGYGTEMMRLALRLCFENPNVNGIVIDPLCTNTRVHKFYQRLGFKIVGRQLFGNDDCLVHRLSRADALTLLSIMS